ncbi:hypothetical protein G195_000188 [Phytophthora kernoviae 00238/432]|uniref:Uncharacterized protein n=1 Tax=Phytophthora kernoviae 00238/432 TaxID=1284355 RepID=A0A8J4WJV6_9STRA|nr:hypothetical protein G195_000188 [Phytophthora kernoviae 00238/432]
MYKRKDGRLFNVSKDFSDVITAFGEDPEMLELAGKMEMRPDDETAIEMCRNVLTLPILAKLNSIFKGRLLLDIGMGIVGHSYGGLTTAIVCRDDDRFACGIGLDSDYCDIVFTSVNEEIRGERDAMEMRNLVTDYTKNFFDHYILQKAASVESLAYDGVDLIKKTSNK